MRRLYSIGDSHSYHGWEQVIIDGISVITYKDFYSKTCSYFGFKKLNLVDIKKLGVNEGDIVSFLFGEIDCTCNIHKFKDQYQEVIDKIVENYFYAIKVNVEQFNNLLVIVSSITPPISKIRYKADAHTDSIFPILGEDEDRKKYVHYMNKRIREKCDEYKYEYLDIHGLHCDENGLLITSLSDGHIHIESPKYIQAGLIKLLSNLKWNKSF
jgi:hypothetical protein